MMSRPLRPLLWVASSKRDYRDFPERVQSNFGFELFLAQTGQHPPSAKPLKGLGGGVIELVEDFEGDAYRAVYAVRFDEAVYVLHAFKKKARRGQAGNRDAQKRHRFDPAAIARCGARSWHALQTGEVVMKVKVEPGSDNIFADLGLPDARAHFLKAQIVSEIYRLTNTRKLTQAQAGKRMGISQPEVSRLFKGNFREYSVDRLMGFLTAFDRDVEIVVRPHKKAGKAGRITFVPVAA
jgi:phage-related protein/predicted XRE-type DNA-binding protein